MTLLVRGDAVGDAQRDAEERREHHRARRARDVRHEPEARQLAHEMREVRIELLEAVHLRVVGRREIEPQIQRSAVHLARADHHEAGGHSRRDGHAVDRDLHRDAALLHQLLYERDEIGADHLARVLVGAAERLVREREAEHDALIRIAADVPDEVVVPPVVGDPAVHALGGAVEIADREGIRLRRLLGPAHEHARLARDGEPEMHRLRERLHARARVRRAGRVQAKRLGAEERAGPERRVADAVHRRELRVRRVLVERARDAA